MNHANFAETTLAAAITTTGETEITITSEASFPAVPFIISIDTECLLVTTVDTVTWTVTRGYEGSTAATHTNGTAIYHDLSAGEADAIAAKLPLAGGTLTGNLIMDNMDVTLVKLLTLHGEIDDGNSGVADTIDWNAGAAHKSTLTDNTTLAFTGNIRINPIMTDFTTPSGVASASATTGSYYAWKAFDNNSSTFWYSGTDPSDASPEYLTYQFVSAEVIARYSILGATSGTYGPKTFKLQASNDGVNWTDLDSQANITWVANVTQTFDIPSPAAYLYYRLRIAAVTAGSCQVCELTLSRGMTDPPAPCFLTLKLVQDATGGRTVTWPATVKGTPHINSAANAVSIVYLYWDGTNYYVVNEAGAAGAGTGDVVGPASATPGNMATYADDTGKNIQDGGAIPTTLPASDVSAWAKEATKPTYASSEITNISAAGQALIDDANAAAQLATLGTAAYSEGTWTPSITGFTVVGSAPVVTGGYKRIGNLVFITIVIFAGAGGNTSVASVASTSGITTFPVAPLGAFLASVVNGVPADLGNGLGSSAYILTPTFTAQTAYFVISAVYFA